MPAGAGDDNPCMSVISQHEAAPGQRWFQGIPRYSWLVLIIAALGWMFDCLDQNLFNLVRQVSVLELLEPHYSDPAALEKAAARIGPLITAFFLVGWATGGFVFGILGDRLGRARTMIITILIYAFFTMLSGFVRTWEEYAVARFLTGIGIGGEFAAGAALVAEVWPNRSRAMALGTLQALSAFGNMGAAVIVYLLSDVGWRVVYWVGVFPALLVVWIRMSIREPERWEKAREQAAAEGVRKELGAIGDLVRDPVLRRNTIAGVLIAIAGVGGLWGVGFFLPDLVGAVLKPSLAHLSEEAQKAALARYRSQAFFIQQIGAFLGIFAYAALSERIGRKPAMYLFFALAFAAVEGTFWGVRSMASAYAWGFVMGFAALAPFSAFAVYFPELFPTRLRATGVGFCYNSARLLAAFAPFLLGSLAAHFTRPDDPAAGLRVAASIVALVYGLGFAGVALGPETRGRPLPD